MAKLMGETKLDVLQGVVQEEKPVDDEYHEHIRGKSEVYHDDDCGLGEGDAKPKPRASKNEAKYDDAGGTFTNTMMVAYYGVCAAAMEAVSCRTKIPSEAAQKVISHELFDQAVVSLILVNCVFLALDDPTAEVGKYV